MTQTPKTACLVLASGLSRRYGPDDKLLADLKGKALLAYCLDAANKADFDGLYIVTPKHDPRAELARSRGFTVIDNPSPEDGIGATIARGAAHLLGQPYVAVCVLLGDMPFVTASYLSELKNVTGYDIVFSARSGRQQPPARFNREALAKLMELKGDKGATSLDLSAFDQSVIKLSDDLALDFDRAEDFRF